MVSTKRGTGGAISIIKMRAESLADLARHMSLHGDIIRPIFVIREKGAYRLIGLHIKLDDSRLMLYTDQAHVGNCLIYRPKSTTEAQSLEFTDHPPANPQSANIQCIPILELSSSPFREAKSRPKINCIMVRDPHQLVRAVISRAMEHDTVGKVYGFGYSGSRYIGVFGLLDDDDARGFTYAKIEAGKSYSFFRYNYSVDNVELTDTFGDPSYIYVRIINLADTPSFFKPE